LPYKKIASRKGKEKHKKSGKKINTTLYCFRGADKKSICKLFEEKKDAEYENTDIILGKAIEHKLLPVGGGHRGEKSFK